MQLPLKTRVLQYAIQHEGSFTVDDIMKGIEYENKAEIIFKKKLIEEYFQSYIGIGFFAEDELKFDEKGELITICKVTDYAKERTKNML